MLPASPFLPTFLSDGLDDGTRNSVNLWHSRLTALGQGGEEEENGLDTVLIRTRVDTEREGNGLEEGRNHFGGHAEVGGEDIVERLVGVNDYSLVLVGLEVLLALGQRVQEMRDQNVYMRGRETIIGGVNGKNHVEELRGGAASEAKSGERSKS